MSLETKKVFLISPVSLNTPEVETRLRDYVTAEAVKGVEVHYPLIHTKQDGDSIGLRIMTDNMNALLDADMVRIFYQTGSWGSVFDLGMTIMAEKLLESVNIEGVVDFQQSAPEDRQVKELILRYSRYSECSSQLYDLAKRLRVELPKQKIFEIEWKGRNPTDLMSMGMAFVARHKYGLKIGLKNPMEVQPQPKKSFDNILIALHKECTEYRLAH